MKPFTKRNVAKFVLKSLVHSHVAVATENTIVDRTSFEEDNIFVGLASHVVGWYVSATLQPITDGMVDKTADWFVARKAKNAEKENTETE